MHQNKSYNKLNLSNEIITRLFNDINYPGNDINCWPWNGILFQGTHQYGIFNLNNKHLKAHRIIYECYNGKIEDDLFVCHHCDNPPCVNYKHLFLGTDLDNKQDMINKNRHAFGINNGMAKLNDDIIIEILEDIKIGKLTSLQQICSIYEIAESPIRDIFSRRLWSHVTEDYTDQELLLLRSKIRSKSVRNALNVSDVKMIKIRLQKGEGLSSIARDYLVSEKTIYNIRRGSSYSSI
jgi:hypothetical protein